MGRLEDTEGSRRLAYIRFKDERGFYFILRMDPLYITKFMKENPELTEWKIITDGHTSSTT